MKEIVYAISNTIYDRFGPDYDIHLEPVEQDFRTPAFSIILTPSKVDENIMGIDERNLGFDVVYYPKVDHNRQELIEMAGLLTDLFRNDLIVNEDLNTMTNIPFLNKSWRIVDDILHFTFNLHFYVDTWNDDSPTMNNLTTGFDTNERN